MRFEQANELCNLATLQLCRFAAMAHWPDIADDLPAPRDDEPSSLRQDIADELADHLSSAFNRELHLTRDESTAKENVLDRFGDPRQIARKLWLDAMQEKLMSQRMTFVALLVVLLASLGSIGLTWFLIDQSRQINQTMLEQSREANAALLEQNQQLLSQSHDSNRALAEQGQKANEALLSKLGQLSASSGGAPEPPRSLEWNQVKIRLYTGEQPGKPAAGYDVSLIGHILDTAKEVTIRRKTNEQGLADLGLIRPGQHKLDIQAPWGESRKQSRVTVFPGQSLLEEIAVPASEPATADIAFDVAWPDDLKNKGMWLVCHFDREPRVGGGTEWRSPNRTGEQLVLISPEGQAVPFLIPVDAQAKNGMTAPEWPFAWTPQIDDIRGLRVDRIEQGVRQARFGTKLEEVRKAGQPVLGPQSIELRLQYATPYLFVFREAPSHPAVRWPIGRYRLHDIIAANDLASLSPQATRELSRFQGPRTLRNDIAAKETTTNFCRVRVIGGLISWQPNRQQQQQGMPFFDPLQDWMELEAIDGRGLSQQVVLDLRKKEQPEFTAEADTMNRWTIALPPRLLERVHVNPAFQPEATEAAVPAAEQSQAAPAKSE